MSDTPAELEARYRSRSFWLDTVPGPLTPRPALPGDRRADVVIVGGGFTGLWTAYYLHRHAPDLDIVVLEAEIAGFGASGRNGGWCSAYLSGLEAQMADSATRAAAVSLQRLMFDTVEEVGRVAVREGIDCHYERAGHIAAAMTTAQLQRDRETVAFARRMGFGEEDYRWLEPSALRREVNVEGALGGFHMSHCAPIHPARLARGLAERVERGGVHIYERTPVTALGQGGVQTPRGRVAADRVLLATEGYTGSLPELRRKLIPVHSTMIATEPLTGAEIEATGLSKRYTWNNGKHLVTYGHLTADGRIAFGSRGRYLYGAAIQQDFRLDDPLFEVVARELAGIFPVLSGKRFTHAWGGAMGVSRSLRPAVCYDGASRVGWAGGYFGDGVGATNLAGRTLADLVLGRDTERSRALWVNPERERSLVRRLWEPEPWRWLAISARYRVMGWADRAEARDRALARPLNWALEHVFP